MDQVQCPVCTLFLHNGMSLESHLDTHPKDQVIKALCNLSNNTGDYGRRTSTPSQSERSYRSRSRSQTPAIDDDTTRWNSTSHSADHERYWHRTVSRTSKATPPPTLLRNCTSVLLDTKVGNVTYDNDIPTSNQYLAPHYSNYKTQQTYASSTAALSEYDQHYQDQHDDKEIKYSKSAEYGSIDDGNNLFSYNVPTISPNIKTSAHLLQRNSRKTPDQTKMLPKTKKIFVKSNVGSLPYITPGIKSMPIMMPAPTAFVQKNAQNNIVMTAGLPTTQIINGKMSTLNTNQYNKITSGAFTPGTTVVAQNSQIIYREMVHNVDGKPFIANMPTVLSSHENVTNVAQTSSMYQNVMVVDQFRNTSCMYPSQVLSKPSNTTMYNNSMSSAIDKPVHDAGKTLIIEVCPIMSPPAVDVRDASTSTSLNAQPHSPKSENIDKFEQKNESSAPTKGLKILSNIKVEVPVQHHKNLLNTVVDLTGSSETEYEEHLAKPEKILPDIEYNDLNMLDCAQVQPSPVSDDSLVPQTFSVIKNVGNPPSYKDSSKSAAIDSKMETELSDSCPVPDLICNEKPSISPVSELSENGENSSDHTTISSIPESSQCNSQNNIESNINKTIYQQKPHRNNPLRLNNIFVKKHKKVLQIKNLKSFPTNSTPNKSELEAKTSSIICTKPENFNMSKIHHTDRIDTRGNGNRELRDAGVFETSRSLHTERSDPNIPNDFRADIEHHPPEIELVTLGSMNNSTQNNNDKVQVKEEINSSNEGGFSNHTVVSDANIAPLESIRPVNVISYGNMPAGEFDDESNHRELLELEAASKNKQFVNMINENYFGDNIYADYFTPDRVESFDSERETSGGLNRDIQREYGVWGEPSQRESEFVLPNFIHESYKIAENGVDYSDIVGSDGRRHDDREDYHGDDDIHGDDVDGDGCERDSKVDVLSESRSEGESSLNIRTDERMPPRGELSGQESNGDMELSWQGMYSDVPPAEHYDLMARESWVSEGSEADTIEKREDLEPVAAKPRQFTCTLCAVRFPSLKELRTHRTRDHDMPVSTTTYSRLVTERIKQEKTEDNILTGVAGNILALADSKEAIPTSMLHMYDTINEAKPKLEGYIKPQSKKRKKDYVCPMCKVDQVTDAAFNEHLKIHPLECLTCGKCFFRRANLSIHMKIHLGIKNYKCEVCDKRFITRQKLKEHHNIHTGRSPVKCTICDDTFRRYSNMIQHRDRHHFQKKAKLRYFFCQCGSAFHSRAKLRWHRETHDDKPKACPYCISKFVHSSSLTRHIRRTHNEYYMSDRTKGKVENVPCPVCKQVYLRTNLRNHLLTHSGKRPFVCIICNKAFTTKWNLKLHRWTHVSRSAKPYKCTLCNGAFIRQSEYISHMNAHKSVRPYTCNYCGCQFIRKYNCQRHVREHEMAKKYVCKVPKCGKSFHRSYYLSEHMKVHSGARPFSCNMCGKTSSNKSNHNKHVKIHNARDQIAMEA